MNYCIRFGFAEGTVEIFADGVANRGLNAQTQAESLKYKLEELNNKVAVQRLDGSGSNNILA